MSNPQPLNGKLALITGASKGIGAATALHLASLGARVVINYSSDPTPAAALVEKIGQSHALAIQADVSRVDEIARLVHEAVAWGGQIDVLVANAGIALMRTVAQTTEEEFERTMNLNVKGPYFLCQKASPHLSPTARIILLSTSLCASSTITPNYTLYVTSKGAIEQLVRVLAKDFGARGITVNCVAPGPTATELFYKGKSEEVLSHIAGLNPFGRIGTPEEIAGVMGYLAGEGGRWVSGQILRVNGGMTVGN